jgi:hypothetical protein
MPIYEYTALNATGKKVKGLVDADTLCIYRCVGCFFVVLVVMTCNCTRVFFFPYP